MPQIQKAAYDRVLLVDDHPTALSMLQMVLNNPEYEIHTATCGQEAVTKAREIKPSLILLDVMMPDMDGFEVCRILKSEPETADATIIFLSAVEDRDAKVSGFDVGAVDYINKPFYGKEVIARVNTHMKIRRLEQRLAARNIQLESRNQSILETMNEGIFGLSEEGEITFANAAAAHMLGTSEEALDGRLISELLHNYDQSLIINIINSGDLFESNSIEITRKDGSVFPAYISCTPNKSNDQYQGAVLVFKDITIQLQQEEALASASEELKTQQQRLAHIERLSTMGEMAAGFAHEVNQPLTAISNYAKVAERFADKISPRPDKLIEVMQKMEKQSMRASDVIKKLRNFVKRPVDGRTRIETNDLILEIVSLAEVDARNNCSQIHLNLDESAPQVIVDVVQIQQVALNLIRNGLEAMSSVGRTESGLWVTTSHTKHHVRVEVRDYGGGLAEGAEDHLFNPFYTTKDNGMGIGLSVCKSIINDHKGEIGAIRQDPGTIFWFELPIEAPEH